MRDLYGGGYNEIVGTEEIEMSIEDAMEFGVVPEFDNNYNDNDFE